MKNKTYIIVYKAYHDNSVHSTKIESWDKFHAILKFREYWTKNEILNIIEED